MGATWARALAALLVGLALVAGCGRGAPSEDAPEVQATLDDVAVDLGEEADELARLALPDLPAGAEVVATQTSRSCTEGQHDWKRDDPFDLSCDVVHTVVVGVPSATTFRPDMADLDRSLQDAGLADRRPGEETSQGLDNLAEYYFDMLGHEGYARHDGELIPYGPQHLPPASYFATEDDLDLTVSFGGPDDDYVGVADQPNRDPAGRILGRDELLDVLGDHAYALLLDVHQRHTW